MRTKNGLVPPFFSIFFLLFRNANVAHFVPLSVGFLHILFCDWFWKKLHKLHLKMDPPLTALISLKIQNQCKWIWKGWGKRNVWVLFNNLCLVNNIFITKTYWESSPLTSSKKVFTVQVCPLPWATPLHCWSKSHWLWGKHRRKNSEISPLIGPKRLDSGTCGNACGR